MSKALFDFLNTQLQKRDELGLKRVLRKNERTLIDFSSNDYLGLAMSQDLFEMIDHTTRQHLKQNGSTGSRLLTGNPPLFEETESNLASLFQAEAGLIFNSGYAANLSVLSSIPQKGDTILYDELAHASLKDGARLSLAARFSFRHNDLNDLEAKLKRASGRKFVVVESVYSMDGDECPLEELCSLAERYDACLIVDEAHSTGVYGENGNGLCVAKTLHERIGVRIYTFGKAMGVHGAFVAGSPVLREYLLNFARPFIYTTALSPHAVISIRCAFQYLKQNIQLQNKLMNNIGSFLSATSAIISRTKSLSAIQTLIVPGNAKVRQASTILMENGFDVRPILSPTVKKGEERLRICLHTFNTSDEIYRLAKIMQEITT